MTAFLTACMALADGAKSTSAAPRSSCSLTNRFEVRGMHCDGCARGISSELRRAQGVVWAEVSFSNKLAVVAYDTNRVSAAALKQIIVEAGYEPTLLK